MAAGARVVLVHDWLTGMRGGEKCLEVFCELWPEARLYTLLHHKGSVSERIEAHPVETSPLQLFPGGHRYYRYLLPLMPFAVNWRLPECDLVFSSSHCVAKGVTPPSGTPHICYCHTPMRYAWQMRGSYLGAMGASGLRGFLMDKAFAVLRRWDRAVTPRVTHFIANSRTVQRRIADCYGREAVVIHPPVNTDFYTPADVPREDYYLVISAFAPYKRLDLALAACQRLGRRLVIIGQGQQERQLRAQAGARTEFLGWQSDSGVRDHLRRCRALLFPGEEDFGIVPVEAQSCGTPVIAFGQGGATETVRPETGLFFAEQSAEALTDALLKFEANAKDYDPVAIRAHAESFNRPRFAREIQDYVDKVLHGS
jgi:glycosyltransferase involved in cell wall biosynthesis